MATAPRGGGIALAIGIAVLSAVALLRVFDPAPIEALRLAVFDLYQRAAPRPFRPGLPVRILDIDEASLRERGQWPWPRPHLAEMVDRLNELGAAVVAFDVVFAEPDRTSPTQILKAWPRTPATAALAGRLLELPDHDELFADSLARGAAVGAVALVPEGLGVREPPPRRAGFAHGGSDPLGFVWRYGGVVRQLPALERGLLGFGSITFHPDRDGVVRRLPLLQALDSRMVPALSVEALRVAQGATTLVARSADASGEVSFGRAPGLVSLRIGQFVVPTTPRGELWVWYAGSRPDRRISAARLFRDDWRALRDAFEGQIVLVGTSAEGLRDLRTTPLASAVPGVEVHAEAIEQIIAGQFLARPAWAAGAELATLLAVGLLLVVLLWSLGPLWSAVAGGLAAAAGATASWLAYGELGLLLDPLYPMLAALLVYLTMTLVRFAYAETERSRVRGAFAHYLAPALVERLAARPEALRLGGEGRKLTLLFADIRDFTALSERLPPEELTARLNRFLTPMTDALLAEGATIDKYMGDAIMAFWNAPLSQPDHGARALRGALAMRRRMAVLAEQWAAEDRAAGREPLPLRFGLGLNTGHCVVGNLGSEQRFDYSAIGDPVNLASRLEGLCKLYGLDILVGETTAVQALDFALVEVDRVRVLGRGGAVTVFALLGDEETAARPEFLAFKARHEAALALYRRGDWDAAEAAFAALADQADPVLQPLYPVLIARVRRYRASPPPSDWAGVFEAERK